MKVITQLVLVFVLFVSFCSNALLAAGVEKSELTMAQIMKLSDRYNKATSAENKAGILEEILVANQIEADAIFYSLLNEADGSDLSCFKTALKKCGTPDLLINFSYFMVLMKTPFNDEVKKNPNMTQLELLKLKKKLARFTRSILGNMDALTPEIGFVARKNPDLLVRGLLEAWGKGNETALFAGPIIGLTAMKEDGAAVVLKMVGADAQIDKGILSILADAFGPYAVIPALKQCENPDSTEGERKVAQIVIFLLPDTEQVYDKVAEAYQHGRYFELKKNSDGKVVMSSIKEMAKMASSWWGNYVKGKYRKSENSENFVAYVAKKYLADSKGQEGIIILLSDVNFGAAAPYFSALDFGKLPEKSLDALLHATYVSDLPSAPGSSRTEEKDYNAEKLRILCLVFKKLDADIRISLGLR